MKQEAHRPGALKQINKSHKTGRHRSKGSISNEVKGKIVRYVFCYLILHYNLIIYTHSHICHIQLISVICNLLICIGKVGVKILSKRATKNLGKDARRHQSLQIRKKKREEALRTKRNLGGSHSAPILVCIIPLQEDLDIHNVLSILTKADENAIITTSPCGTTHLRYTSFMVNR